MSHVQPSRAAPQLVADPDEHLLDLTDSLWDLLPAAIYVCNRDGQIVRYNSRAGELWGRKPRLGDPKERFCGSHRLYRLDGGPLPHAQCPMAEVLATGVPAHDLEVVIERPDGSRSVALVNIDPLKDESGTLVGAINCLQDITERKRVEEELRASRRDLDDFFENSVVPKHMVASDGTILRANRAELDLLGYRADEYVGRHIAEFHADRATIDDMLARLSHGEELHKHPARLRAKDGSIKEVVISSSAQFRDGDFINTRCVTLDVSAERRAEAALRESEGRLRSLLDALPAAVYTTDAKGRLTYYNRAAAELAGREPKLGSDEWCVTWKLYRPDGTRLPHHECPMAVALKEDRPVRGAEAVAERPDGTRIPFIPYPTPLHDESGALVGAVNMLVDITERKRAEMALRDSEAWLVDELQATKLLQGISTELMHENGIEGLYDKIVDAATAIMRSEYASLQMLYPERGAGGELRLLAFRGFNPQAAKFWEWVRADSESTCGAALRTGKRVIAEDVSRCDFMAGTEDLKTYLQTGIHAVQTTPLVSRSGQLLGMISTHWRRPHSPTDSDLRRFDVLARQAADLLERAQADEQQKLLIREMSHRTKNLFAVASSLVTMSARSARTPVEMAEAIRERFGALTCAHDLIRPVTGDVANSATSLDALIRAIFAPYIDPNSADSHDRLIAEGPHVPVGGAAATALALVLHELATNAAKYGALSSAAGSVEIGWTVDTGKLQLNWIERGGPIVERPPDGEGFGSLLIRGSVAGQLGGELAHEWKHEGLVLKLSIATDRLDKSA